MTTKCPLCGISEVHEHTGVEQTIYRNGVKFGSAPQWVSVRDALPEFFDRHVLNSNVLVWHTGKGWLEGPMSMPQYSVKDAAFDGKVSHWMKLPDSPASGEAK